MNNLPRNNKIPITLMFGIFIFSIANIFALQLSGGECNSFEFQNSKPVNFELVSNTTLLEDFTWNQSGKQITYCFSIIQEQGTFTLRWFNELAEEEKEVEESGGGGSGVSKPYIIPKDEIEKGLERTLKKGRNIHFEIENEHKLTIQNISEDTATFLIESDPVILILEENQTELVCLSENEKIELTNLNIVGEYVNFNLKSLDASDCKQEETDKPTDTKDKDKEEPKEDKKDEVPSSEIILWGIAIIIICVVVLSIFKGIDDYINSNSKEQNPSSEENELNQGDDNEQE